MFLNKNYFNSSSLIVCTESTTEMNQLPQFEVKHREVKLVNNHIDLGENVQKRNEQSGRIQAVNLI